MQEHVNFQMQSYRHYAIELERLLHDDPTPNFEATSEALNGNAYGALRNLVSLSTLRSTGAFFTGHEIADELASWAKEEIKLGVPFIDPACGAGNLLLAAARHLPLEKSLVSTLSSWGEIIHGIDVHSEFVEATKLRLTLLAKIRGNFINQHPDLNSIFPNIVCADSLSTDLQFHAPIILLNPPYQGMKAPDNYRWGEGRVSAAAVFLDHVVRNSIPGCRIFALLPEVLRCGTRYQLFREFLGKRVEVVSEKSLGLFDRWTDIDVFSSEMLVLDDADRQKVTPAFTHRTKDVETIGDRFNIHVGPLVDYRSPKCGPQHPYIEAAQATPWEKKYICTSTRQFNGTVFPPPFVVIRRNSRPNDKFRAVGTVIMGDAPVAVENHLVVALPKQQTIKACLELLHVLRRHETNDFLNNIMRCRHLTIEAVKNIPWA